MIETMAGGVAVFDCNGDGLPDIYFTNGAAIPSLKKESPKYFNRLFRNNGGMKFTDVTEAAGLAGHGYDMGAAAADYDNDGDVDLFVAGAFRNTLYRNDGDGNFGDVTSDSGIKGGEWSVAAGWFDYDNDGWLDLFVVNYANWSLEFDQYCGDKEKGVRVYCDPKHLTPAANRLYRNQGDGTFEDVTERSGIQEHLGRGMSVAFADADGDGRVDVVVSSLGERAEIWENISPNDNNWLGVRLVGTKSNRDGIGARIAVDGQHNSMTSAVSYASSSHDAVHFGLGDADERACSATCHFQTVLSHGGLSRRCGEISGKAPSDSWSRGMMAYSSFGNPLGSSGAGSLSQVRSAPAQSRQRYFSSGGTPNFGNQLATKPLGCAYSVAEVPLAP